MCANKIISLMATYPAEPTLGSRNQLQSAFGRCPD